MELSRRALLRFLALTPLVRLAATILPTRAPVSVAVPIPIPAPPPPMVLLIDRELVKVTAVEGLTMRFVRNYNIQRDQRPTRFDMCYGMGTVRPDLVYRVVDPTIDIEGA